MKFLSRAITLVLAMSLLSNTLSLNAGDFSAWASSFFSSAPKAATNQGFSDWTKTFFPSSVPVAKPVKVAAEALPAWVEKFNFKLEPVKGLYRLAQVVWNNKCATGLSITASCFFGYIIINKYMSWWDEQCDERRQIHDQIEYDVRHPRRKGHKDSVLLHAAKCQTLLFAQDSTLVSYINEFYTVRKNNSDAAEELRSKANIVVKHLWGYFKKR